MVTNVQKYIKEGEIIARNALLTLVFLTIIKLAAGIITGITVLLVDALSSATDILSLFASYIGLKLSHKGAKKGFQYGYHKVETFAALVVSIMIIYLGYKVIRKSVDILIAPEPGQYTLLGVGVVLITIAFSLQLARELTRAAENANSLALMNNAKDKKMDVVSSLAVLGGIVANYFGIPYLEGAIGILLSLLILKVGLYSAKEALFYLLDFWDDNKLVDQIKKVLDKEGDLVKNVKKIRLRRAGTFIFGEAFLEIDPFANMQDLRNDINKLSDKVQGINPHIKDFIIYEMIQKPQKIRVAIPITKDKGMKSKIAENLYSMTHYIFVDIRNRGIRDSKVEKFTFKGKSDYIGLVEFLKKKKTNILINNDLNSLLYFQLQHICHIEIYPKFSNIDTVEDAIKVLLIDT